jgi:hypothetical protein
MPTGAEVALDNRTLPEEVTVWAVPHLTVRNRRLLYRVFVAGPGYDMYGARQTALQETGQECKEISTINFGRRFAEGDVSSVVWCLLTSDPL